jgi:outer membrane protein TolC
VQATGLQTRLDLRLARAAWEGAARASQLGQINTRSDLDITLQSDIVRDSSGSAVRNGVGLEVTLPLFDDGSLRRTTLDARALALANQLQATERVAASQLRESYAHYRSNYELARHYRDEMVPLRKTMAAETLLRYNGMLIGVFDLLTDAQEQATVVRAALGAQQQFWLSDAALQASLMGRPLLAGSGLNLPLSKGSSDAAH